MLTAYLLALAASAPLAAPSSPTGLPVEAHFDGRGRVHAVEATLQGDVLIVSGRVTAPVPYPAGRRAVSVEVLDAEGLVLHRSDVPVEGVRGPVVRRRPATGTLALRVEGLAEAASVRIAPAGSSR